MLSNRKNYYFLLFSLVIVIWLAVAQVTGSMLLLIPCLAAFFVLIGWAKIKGFVLPLLLFFLPWSPILKPGTGLSMYTVALLAVLVISLIAEHRQMDARLMIPVLFLLGISLLVKAFNGYSVDNTYIMFMACLLFFPLLCRETGKKYDFYALTLFFSLGIITAALSAQQLVVYPMIARYIDVYTLGELTRYSGYYGDSNFYSAQVTAALSGVLILILKESQVRTRLFLFIVAMVLIYCGLLSGAKSFFLIMICILLLWGIEILFMRGKISYKLLLIAACAIGGLYVLSSTLFTDLITMVLERFESSGSMSDLTTHRSELWLDYLIALGSDIKLLLFGQGFTNQLLNGKSSHNTLIQIIYQSGITGVLLQFIWIGSFVKNMLNKLKLRQEQYLQVMILLIGVFGPWMALDLLFFDEFFLMIVFVCIGIRESGFTKDTSSAAAGN